MNANRLTAAAALAALTLTTPRPAAACSFSSEPYFWRATRPEASADAALRGELGVVRPSWRLPWLWAAWRQLSGLPLSDAQRPAVAAALERSGTFRIEVDEAQQASQAWVAASGEKTGRKYESAPESQAWDGENFVSFLNCHADAFRTATADLTALSARVPPAELRTWVSGQDMVFATCARPKGELGVVPAMTVPEGKSLAAYQAAAMQLYAGSYAPARAAFDAVAQGAKGPLRIRALLSAARCELRLARNPAVAEAERTTHAREAKRRLELLAADKEVGEYGASVARLLGLLGWQLDPAGRRAALSAAVLRNDTGPQLAGDVTDWATRHSSPADQKDELDAWATALRAGPSARATTLATWKQKGSLPWLLAAAEAVDPASPEATAVLTALDKVPTTSPGFVSASFEAARLDLLAGKRGEARKRLERVLADPKLAAGTRQQLQLLRALAAPDLATLLAEARVAPQGRFEDATTEVPVPDMPAEVPPALLGLLDESASEATLLALARTPTLPAPLRRGLGFAAFTRAIQLDDDASAKVAAELLIPLDAAFARDLTGWLAIADARLRHHAGVLLLSKLRNLSPDARNIEAVGRGPLLGAGNADLTHFCGWAETPHPAEDTTWSSFGFPAGQRPGATPHWLDAAGRKALTEEQAKRKAAGSSVSLFLRDALAFAKESPADPRVPEQLHWAIQSGQKGCTDGQSTALGKQAFTLLKGRYGKTPWAAKTKYFW